MGDEKITEKIKMRLLSEREQHIYKVAYIRGFKGKHKGMPEIEDDAEYERIQQRLKEMDEAGDAAVTLQQNLCLHCRLWSVCRRYGELFGQGNCFFTGSIEDLLKKRRNG